MAEPDGRSVLRRRRCALTRFFAELRHHLSGRGRVLMFFGTSGDIDYLYRLSDRHRFSREVVASRDLKRDDTTVTYFAWRLTP